MRYRTGCYYSDRISPVLTVRLNSLPKELNVDSLTHLFTQFQFRTDLFHLGQLCQIGSFNEENKGYLHFVRQGRFILNQAAERPITIERPAIIFHQPIFCIVCTR